MKNKEVIDNFIDGGESKVKNVYSKYDGLGRLALYSYGVHFPIALRLNDCYLVNKDKYSSSTSAHQNYFKNSCNGKMIFIDTDKLIFIINYKDFKTEAEFIEAEL